MALRVPRRFLARIAAITFAVAAVVGPAQALPDNGQPHASTVAFSVHTKASPRADQIVRDALFRLGIDAGDVDIEHGLEEMLGTAAVGLFGPKLTATCTGTDLTVEVFEDALTAAEEHVAFAEFSMAAEALRALRVQLPCLDETIEPERLHRLHLLEGVASWYVGERNAGHTAFERAVVLNESYRWAGEFGPRPQELHVQAMRAVLARPPATLALAWSGDNIRASLDGLPIELTEGWGQIEVRAGEHLLLVQPVDGPAWRAVVELDGETVIVERQAFLSGMAALETGEAAYQGPGRPVLAALSNWMRRNGYSDGYLVAVPPPPSQRETDPALPPPTQRTVLRIDPREEAILKPRPVEEQLATLPWRGRFSLNGGVLAFRREHTTYLYGKVEGTLWVHALPNLGVGWTVGVASFWDNDLQANIVIVPIRSRLRISPDYGMIRPFVDFAMVVHWLGTHDSAGYSLGDDGASAEFSFGGEGTVGLDFRPISSRLLGCGAGVGVGHVGGVTFNLQGGCSVQW